MDQRNEEERMAPEGASRTRSARMAQEGSGQVPGADARAEAAPEAEAEPGGPQEGNGEAEETPFLSRVDILRAQDSKVEVVEVPEWGGRVRVKAMTGTERDAFESDLVVNKGKKDQYTDTRNVRAKLAARTVVDAEGKPMFSPGDIATLGQKSAAALDRVFKVAMRLSKITEEDLEELEGNSGPDLSGDS